MCWGFGSCATIVAPTGGSKDTAPPELLQCKPEQNSININTKNAVIYFNEYIQLKTTPQHLYILPNTPTPIVASAFGKQVRLTLPNGLLKNTTYVVYFKSAISDITENNILQNFEYVFSTGPRLDTNQITIKPQVSNGEKDFSKYIAYLYDDTASIATILECKTQYQQGFQKEDELEYKNITADRKTIVVIKDENANKKYDAYKEWIGVHYASDTGAIKNNTVRLVMFREKSKLPMLLNTYCVSANKAIMVFNQPTKIDAIIGVKGTAVGFETDQQGDSIWIYHEAMPEGEKAIVTYNNTQTDTVDFNKNTSGRKQKTKEQLLARLSSVDGKLLNDTLYIGLIPAKPLNDGKNIESSWTENGVSMPVAPIFRIVNYQNHTTLAATYNWKANAKYSYMIPAGQVQHRFLTLSNDTIKGEFKRLFKNDFGSISIPKPVLISNEKHTVLIIENTKTKKQYRYANPQYPIEIKEVPPGSYNVSLLLDINQNKMFDTGNISEKKQPETILVLPKIQEIKSGFTTIIAPSKSRM
jgi:hypothetical protein